MQTADPNPKSPKTVSGRVRALFLGPKTTRLHPEEEALSYHSRNRAKTDETAAEKGLPYHGLAVPDEWLQSFSDWTLNH
ncbi:hypothetical protein PGT21_011819 [Puccinia graminis f. sp. tritici]|uniref:Uncharacterized protein n=1 Tax=Puccinia graminis f. sp. tritici TaxID=56615 RepID=A0A5B0PQW4_PUCGR|nr:hypothetical protein PGT21_011819 [Puccinia graminis f. sp. tritici]